MSVLIHPGNSESLEPCWAEWLFCNTLIRTTAKFKMNTHLLKCLLIGRFLKGQSKAQPKKAMWIQQWKRAWLTHLRKSTLSPFDIISDFSVSDCLSWVWYIQSQWKEIKNSYTEEGRKRILKWTKLLGYINLEESHFDFLKITSWHEDKT